MEGMGWLPGGCIKGREEDLGTLGTGKVEQRTPMRTCMCLQLKRTECEKKKEAGL